MRLVWRRAPGVCCLVVASTILALAGCQETPPPTVPTPLPTTARPTETQQERRERVDREAAEKAYLATRSAAEKMAMAGGGGPDKVIRENAAGPYLRLVTTDLGILKKNGWRTDRPTSSSVTANRGWSLEKIGLTACEDASKVRLLDSAGQEVAKDRSRRFVQELTATRIDGRWKITDIDSKIVKTFDGEAGCQL